MIILSLVYYTGNYDISQGFVVDTLLIIIDVI